MSCKFEVGDLVRFTHFDKFTNDDYIGYILRQSGMFYHISDIIGNNGDWFSRSPHQIKLISQEDALLYLLEKQQDAS